MADHGEDNSTISDGGEPLPAEISALSAEDQADLFNSLKDAGKHYDSQFIDSLSPEVKKRVEVLRGIETQYDDLEKRYLEEQAALEAKYQKLYEPLYTMRYEVVNGVVEVEAETADAVTDQENKVVEEKGVPNFWLDAMKNNDILGDEITERDEGALKYLKDIKWFRLYNPKDFRLEFFFDSNPYFKNSVLTKTYHMVDGDTDRRPILSKAIGTRIEWYPGKCLTYEILRRWPKTGSKKARMIETERCESFFNFFQPPQAPQNGDDDDDDDDIDVEEIEDQLKQDLEIGMTIGEKLIPQAVLWYTGEAVERNFYGFDNVEDDDDEDSDEDEDEEEDSNEKKKAKTCLQD